MTTPILNKLVENGDIRIEGDALIGIASDGVEVAIGTVHTKEAAERYLTDFPTPDKW